MLLHFLTLSLHMSGLVSRPFPPNGSNICVFVVVFSMFSGCVFGMFLVTKQVAKICTPPYQFDRAAPEPCTVEKSGNVLSIYI